MESFAITTADVTAALDVMDREAAATLDSVKADTIVKGLEDGYDG